MVAAGVIQFSKYLLGLTNARHHVKPGRPKWLAASGLGLKPDSLGNSGPGNFFLRCHLQGGVSLLCVLAQLTLIRPH